MRIDRRNFPRRPAKWSVAVRTANGVELKATSVEVGAQGMQLSLDRGGLLRLCPRGHLTSRADELDLRLELQTEDIAGDAPIEIQARVCHVRRLSQFEYRLAVEFLEFTEASAAQQFTRLLECLESCPNPTDCRSEPLECDT